MNRNIYLVQGLGHCNTCHTTHTTHTTRNLLGASEEDTLNGGKIMGVNWYAPSLFSHLEAGGGEWTLKEYVELLSIGISERVVASRSMATIVGQSLQYLSPEDIRAKMQHRLDQGGKLYASYCESCHGESSEDVPPLAGHRSVIMDSPVNTIRSVLYGGYPPATTAGNPRPYGMPPFQQIFRDDDVARVVSYIRNAWGNCSSEVTTVDVNRSRGGDH